MQSLVLAVAVILSTASASAFARSKISPPIPGVPSQLTAAATSPSSVHLTWNDNTTGETGFRIERSLDTNRWVTAGSTAADVTQFDDSGLPDNTRYYYRVLAFDSGGATEPSAPVSVNTPQGYWALSGRVVEGNDFAPVSGATVSVTRGASYQSPLFAPGTNIPDSNATGITEAFEVNSGGTIEHVAFALKITHPYLSDLKVSLIHPDGTRVILHRNSSGRNIDTVYPTTTTPAQPLTAFSGKPANGLWSLEVIDGAGGDVGTLVSFQLTLTGTAATVTATSDAQGYYTFSNVASGRIAVGVTAPNLNFTERNVDLRGDTTRVNFVSDLH